MANLSADLRKLLEWLDRVSSLIEAQIVAAGLNHTLDKALMRNFAEMNLREATVSITARGRDALSKSLVMHPRTGPRTAALRPRFRTIKVCPKDRLTLPRQAPDASNRLHAAVPNWYDRRRHPWEGAPCSASGGASSSRCSAAR